MSLYTSSPEIQAGYFSVALFIPEYFLRAKYFDWLRRKPRDTITDDSRNGNLERVHSVITYATLDSKAVHKGLDSSHSSAL